MNVCRDWAAKQVKGAFMDAPSFEVQRRYDNAYIQCMYAKGHQVPGRNLPARTPAPPAGSPRRRHRRLPQSTAQVTETTMISIVKRLIASLLALILFVGAAPLARAASPAVPVRSRPRPRARRPRGRPAAGAPPAIRPPLQMTGSPHPISRRAPPRRRHGSAIPTATCRSGVRAATIGRPRR